MLVRRPPPPPALAGTHASYGRSASRAGPLVVDELESPRDGRQDFRSLFIDQPLAVLRRELVRSDTSLPLVRTALGLPVR
jgi:hypothetical protein